MIFTRTGSVYKSQYFFTVLSVMSGLLLGFSFPPSPFYSLAYVAFIPFLYIFSQVENGLKLTKYSYIFLLIFQIITIYWVGGFTVGKDVWMMIAGAVVIVIHPLFFIPFILLAFFVKRRLGLKFGLAAFSFLWVAFEYLHSLGEYSFPWLTIGNSQAYDIDRIQLAAYLSVYGLSLILILFNSVAFLVLYNDGKPHRAIKSFRAIGLIFMLLLVYFGTDIYGKMVVKRESIGTGKKIRIGVIQPDFDPWEKWEGKPGEKFVSHLEQFNTFIRETKILAKEKPDMIIWPETAVPFYILLPRYYKSLSDLFVLVDTLHIPVFTGLPVADYFDSLNAPATAQRAGSSQLYVETYNSTVLVEPGRKLGPIHRKTILVPFAERIPYAESFKFLIEPLKWNVGISGWGKGADTIVNGIITGSGDTLKFASLICYESVYPDYTRELVRKGAGMLVIVTNDSWWGNTSGAYQHAAYASLRAVETRRWVVQCANGGISEVVDPAGTVRYKTGLYTQARFIDEVHLRSDQTFYVMHGDLTGKICILISMLLIGVSLAGKKHRAEK